MLSNTRTHCHTAFAMLLLWTLTIASGFANACLLEQPGAHSHTAATAHGLGHGGTQVSRHTEALDETSGAVHHSQPDYSQPVGLKTLSDPLKTSPDACLKVCDDSARSLPKQHASSLLDLGHMVVVAVSWSAGVATMLEHGQPNDAQVVTSRLPLRVRYARLAL